eukprot:TRINITY_DN49104_c0_g1_i1.p1 TRINITY_DN49104_c0_g1~~TRINITY_DN49104_c0_g1_i1.p1  ORF type:complete len:1365 (+),score=214.65 TRINITY_DN49104_c0_g1_i1:282-4097(+)
MNGGGFWAESHRHRGQWVDTASGALGVPPVCELRECWCPQFELEIGMELSYVANVTEGLRLGTRAQSLCFGDKGLYVYHSGNPVARCVPRDDGIEGGRWVQNAVDAPPEPLKCKLRDMGSGGGGGAGTVDPNTLPAFALRTYQANATLGCRNELIQVHGEMDPFTGMLNHIYCVLAASTNFTFGTGGRWSDNPVDGDNAEYPVCMLKSDWCPPLSIEGHSSTVAALTDAYNFGSIASIRCLVGYRRVNGSERVKCINSPSELDGIWDGPPLYCDLDRHFCPTMLPVNAYSLEPRNEYVLGDQLTFRCRRGFIALDGDTEAECKVGQGGRVGTWLRADGAPARALRCTPAEDYCRVPTTANGYVASVSGGPLGSLGSILELRCLDGFRDKDRGVDRRTAVCVHTHNVTDGGSFHAGVSHDTRDLMRAISVVREFKLGLEHHYEGRLHRLEDDDTVARLGFEARWRRELDEALGSLRESRQVAAALRYLPEDQFRGGDATMRLTLDHLRAMLRLLTSVAEEAFDVSAEQALVLWRSYDKLRVSFQPLFSDVPSGWLVDAGEPLGDRGNGFFYGWKCDIRDDGALDRERVGYTALENTLVATDPHSRCDSQEWRIRLPAGRYNVEVTVQDPQQEHAANGCLLQGEPLGLPESVRPPGAKSTRSLTVDVIDFLSLVADHDDGCTSVNRLAIQSITDVGARRDEDPLLSCSPILEWCTPPPQQPLARVTKPPPATARSPQARGGEVEYECPATHVYFSHERLICGSDRTGRRGMWRSQTLGPPRVDLDCLRSRNTCPPLMRAVGAARLLSLTPPSYEVGAVATFACRRGFKAVGGDAKVRCTEHGVWVADPSPVYGKRRQPWVEGMTMLQCEAIPDYCPGLNATIADLKPAYGLTGADEPLTHYPITSSTVVPVGSGALAAHATAACPTLYDRILGDVRLVCGHGPPPRRRGVWQPEGLPTSVLVDDSAAELLACQLDTTHGVRRLFYSTAERPHGAPGSNGHDIVPNIDQTSSPYDAAHFEAHIRPSHTGTYKFAVEVVGRFLLSFRNRVLLTGRSLGSEPKTFVTGSVKLSADQYYEVSLQFALDPEIPRTVSSGLAAPRHVRLLWSRGGASAVPVPPSAFYHGFSMMRGFPMTFVPLNDPLSCTSDERIQIVDIPMGYEGLIYDGSPTRNHNPNLHCKWFFRALVSVRYEFTVNFFDLEETAGCTKDRVEIRSGNEEDGILQGKFCGQFAPGTVLVHFENRKGQAMLDFLTDPETERGGFNVTVRLGEFTGVL